MPKYETADIRNLLIAGSTGAGKTTLIEAMLHKAGVTGRIGRVEDGNTVCDYEELEQEFKHSLDSAFVHFDFDGAHINLIDTPGSPDFIGKAVSALPAVETAVIMIDPVVGVNPVVRRLMKVCEERKLPRMIVINKIDAGVDAAECLENLQETYGSVVRPINLPAKGGTEVVDCFAGTAGESDMGPVAEFHTAIVDQVVEVDEELMAKYLEAGEVDPAELRPAFAKALREAHLIPVCFCSAREGVGVKELMEAFAELCPSPLQGNPRHFIGASGDVLPVADSSKPLIAHVFKVTSDPYVGKLCFFKVHQGHVGSDIHPRINDGKKGVRIAHVFKAMGKEHKEIDSIPAGDIGAVAKIEDLDYDAVLHDGTIDEGLHFDSIPLSKPMYGLAIEGTSKGAETKMGEALRKLVSEDPTFQVERVVATGQLVVRGLGEQHLRVKLRLLKDRYGVEVASEPPKVAYKETIRSKGEGHHRHKKQTGGAGQFGEVYLRVEPLKPDEAGEAADGMLFVDDTFGGSIPKQFLPAIEKGVRRVMHEGAVAGYPLEGIKVSVYDGKYHPVDSKEIAFMTAGRRAFIDAVQKAHPVLLEPFVAMEITIPANMIGDISSDISGRRGRIQGTEMLPGNQATVTAEAPLAEVMSYANQLKSITAGAGSYAMEYSHDEPTPPNVQAEVVAAFKPKDEED